MTTQRLRVGALIAALFLGLHLVAGLPASLEDLDSINFARGIGDYDVALHQPHPPGYPVYIIAARLLHAPATRVAALVRWTWTEAWTLGLLSVLAGTLAAVALMWLFAALDRDRREETWTWLAVLVAVTCPLFWFTASRPMSDMFGLAAAIAIQAMLLRVGSVRSLALAAAAAGLAAGIRSQVIWLTVPLLLLAVLRVPRGVRWRGACAALVAYGAAVLVWAIPMLWDTGGLAAYWAALSSQGTADLNGVEMLATTPTLHQLVTVLQYTFVAPWGYWQLAAFALPLAALGLVQIWRQSPRALMALAVAFGPYLMFDFLFQESFTTRYALPLVVPVAYLAVRGVSLFPSIPATGVALTLVGVSVAVNDSMLAGFVQNEAPAFRMLKDMARAQQEHGGARDRLPVLAMHRRQEFDLRRPIRWMADAMPKVEARLPSPPKHEWLELVKYWNGGGRSTVWFVADPLRSDLALVGASNGPASYGWTFAPTILLGGVRPNTLDWHIFEPPAWYVGEGWALTPETAGVAKEDGKGPGMAPVSAWVKRPSGALNIVVGGRNLSKSGATAHLTIAVDGREVHTAEIAPGFFLRIFSLDMVAGPGDYAPLTIAATDPDFAIEQFDARPAGEPVFGFADGWHEHEYNPATGIGWRWTSDRATIRVRPEGRALVLTLGGEIEAAASSHVIVRSGARVVGEFDVDRQFTRTVIVPADALAQPEAEVTIESSASYIPAETRWRSKDRRRLGLKLTECRLTPVS
ncbi:MAG: DUF2723 domain-containing protein [Acidobacteriaceae bacterium]|nr:DUF2723 domain-containing protein [Acidobacteriaceae bacterium]